jgi:hypothetical protein
MPSPLLFSGIPPNMLEDFDSVKLLDLSHNKLAVSPNASFRHHLDTL